MFQPSQATVKEEKKILVLNMTIPKIELAGSLPKKKEREREKMRNFILIRSNSIKTSRFKSGPSEYF